MNPRTVKPIKREDLDNVRTGRLLAERRKLFSLEGSVETSDPNEEESDVSTLP